MLCLCAGCCSVNYKDGTQSLQAGDWSSKGWISLYAPGEEGLVLLDRVQFVGGRVAPFARQLLFGVIAGAGAGDVDVAPAEVAAALQGG